MVDELEHPRGEGGPLDGKGGKEKVERYAPKPISTEKCHEKTESDKYHDVDILEHCARGREREGEGEEREEGEREGEGEEREEGEREGEGEEREEGEREGEGEEREEGEGEEREEGEGGGVSKMCE